MSGDATRHVAHVTETGSWAVSWLPNRVFTRNEAITAMTIAEAVGAHDVLGDPLHAGHRLWVHLDSWAAELSLSGPHALALASLSPEDHEDMPRVVTLAPDSEPGRRGYLVALDRSTGTARVRIGGETVIMPACHLQYADAAPCGLCRLRAERGVEPPPGGCTCQASGTAPATAK